MHPEFHIGLALSMDNERSCNVAVISNAILLDHILEAEYVGDGFLAIPHISVALESRLVAHRHGPTVTREDHLLHLSNVGDEVLVAVETHCTL